jgi:peptide/nickel transport system ATP-binding protein
VSDPIILKIENLKVHFKLHRPHLLAPPPLVHAVDGVSFKVRRAKTFGLVGESGCGKSTTALAILRLVEATAGSVFFNGVDVMAQNRKSLRLLRRRMQMVFQDPYSSLNPKARVGSIVGSPLKIQGLAKGLQRRERVAELLTQVGLRPEQATAFPHQFSGGQRQRICIARALALNPDLIVCDEPVSALDVAIQAQILNLLRRLQQELHLSYLFISHDLGVVQYMCDEIAVMYLGRIVEQADRIALFSGPRHPYTRALLSAAPSARPKNMRPEQRIRLTGEPPSPIDPPPGCRFAPRCPFAVQLCRMEDPPLRPIHSGHWAACHLIDDNRALTK